MPEKNPIEKRFEKLSPWFDERMRRLWAAAEAEALGFGGVTTVARCTGVSRRAIAQGCRELREGARSGREPAKARIRRAGGGRKRATSKEPRLLETLLALVEPATRGDPESPLRWTSKSVRHLAGELQKRGLQASHQLVAELLQAQGYSLQANAKTRAGGGHIDRNAQFEHINDRILAVQGAGEPVISVETKKKELVFRLQNSGREWHPKGSPEAVRVHDFLIPELGRANPTGSMIWPATKAG